MGAATQKTEPVLQHVQLARSLIQQIIALSEHITSVHDDPPEGLAVNVIRMRAWALRSLNELNDNPAQAVSLGEQLAADSERVLGPDDPGTLESWHSLALAYLSADRLEEAIHIFERTVAGQERVLGTDHGASLASRGSLAHTYLLADRLDDAIRILERTVADQRRVLGADHLAIAISMNSLAMAYDRQGRPDKAFPLPSRASRGQ